MDSIGEIWRLYIIRVSEELLIWFWAYLKDIYLVVSLPRINS